MSVYICADCLPTFDGELPADWDIARRGECTVEGHRRRLADRVELWDSVGLTADEFAIVNNAILTARLLVPGSAHIPYLVDALPHLAQAAVLTQRQRRVHLQRLAVWQNADAATGSEHVRKRLRSLSDCAKQIRAAANELMPAARIQVDTMHKQLLDVSAAIEVFQ